MMPPPWMPHSSVRNGSPQARRHSYHSFSGREVSADPRGAVGDRRPNPSPQLCHLSPSYVSVPVGCFEVYRAFVMKSLCVPVACIAIQVRGIASATRARLELLMMYVASFNESVVEIFLISHPERRMPDEYSPNANESSARNFALRRIPGPLLPEAFNWNNGSTHSWSTFLAPRASYIFFVHKAGNT